MPSDNAQKVNIKMLQVFSGKIWAHQLNFVPVDKDAVKAMDSMLDYVAMLQKQVKGLERQIQQIRGGG